ncbi:hypothetical protein [Clostridium oceanicum]|uniref:Uncharacterized protein n=1 Tax=Clostridium oceanicum TaxID=1543 RepID=A0ABP3V5R1_9CLOT
MILIFFRQFIENLQNQKYSNCGSIQIVALSEIFKRIKGFKSKIDFKINNSKAVVDLIMN